MENNPAMVIIPFSPIYDNILSLPRAKKKKKKKGIIFFRISYI